MSMDALGTISADSPQSGWWLATPASPTARLGVTLLTGGSP